jgi:hypothetical protein
VLFPKWAEWFQVLAAIAVTSAVGSGLPPIAQPTFDFLHAHQVTGRFGSPLTETIASVTFWIISFLGRA